MPRSMPGPDPLAEPGLALAPAARLLWRTPDTVQFELAGRAAVVSGLPASVIRAVVAATAPTPVGPQRGSAVPSGSQPWPPGTADALALLAADGYLWPVPDRGTDTAPDRRLAPPDPRLAGELTALTSRVGTRAAGMLTDRARRSVDVHGPSRLAAHLAALLAASGAARVRCLGEGSAKLAHAAPGGVLPSDEGGRWSAAAREAIRRAAPEADRPRAPGTNDAGTGGLDLVVLAGDHPPDDDRVQALHAARTAHLVVSLGPDRGTVGPLVVPGLTGCLRCADLHRRDRDPAWPSLAVQLAVPRRHGPASGTALAAVVAGIAALQVLRYLDGEQPDVVDGAFEIAAPDGRLRRRTWPPHAACGCGAADVSEPLGTMDL